MEHDDDGRVVAERLHVTGFLIAAVAYVVRMANRLQIQPPRELAGVVIAMVVDNQDAIIEPGGDGAKRRLDVSLQRCKPA